MALINVQASHCGAVHILWQAQSRGTPQRGYSRRSRDETRHLWM